MAKIKVLGNALTLTSELKKSEIEKAEKFCPEATKLVDEEKVPYFVVKTGAPSAGKYGVSFDAANANGLAYMTMVSNEAPTKEEIKESFGEILFNLNQVEKSIKSTLESLEEKINTLEESIEIVD